MLRSQYAASSLGRTAMQCLHHKQLSSSMLSLSTASRLPAISMLSTRSFVTIKQNLSTNHPSTSQFLSTSKILVQCRGISSQDVFNVKDSLPTEALPTPPTPLPPTLTAEELVSQGESCLEELGLWSPWKPSSYLRWGLESLHIFTDTPWWLTISIATIILRLSTIYVPIMSNRFSSIHQNYKPELNEFKERVEEARREGNNLLIQQVIVEQQDFMRKRGFKPVRQLMTILGNGAIFCTMFFALKRMAAVDYPGFSTGGILWFTDLTACDPYYILPLISAISQGIIIYQGIEFGSSDMMSPKMRLLFQFGVPAIIIFCSSQFSSALCVYWATTNIFSVLSSRLFRIPAVRSALNIPQLVVQPKSAIVKSEKGFIQSTKDAFAKSQKAPSITELRKRDKDKFESAGRSKPHVN